MIIGSAFTLFIVPSIYVLVARTHRVPVPVQATGGGMDVPELAAIAS
jgi:hypothetical protein